MTINTLPIKFASALAAEVAEVVAAFIAQTSLEIPTDFDYRLDFGGENLRFVVGVQAYPIATDLCVPTAKESPE